MAKLRIEVVHLLAGRQEIAAVQLPEGATAVQAAVASGLGTEGDPLGIGGKEVSPAQVLRDGDRVELLRPLAYDPGEARRRRVRGKKPR